MLSVHATDGVQVLFAGFLDKSRVAFPKQQVDISRNGCQTPRQGEPKGLGHRPCYTAARLSACSSCFCASRLAVGCSLLVAAPPPPLLCLAVFVAAARCSVFFSSAASLLPACLALAGGSRRLLPYRPRSVRACCLVLSGGAALLCPSVGCLAVPCCRVLRCASCCGASPCCVLGCCALCGVC